jgi:hypothetical protein
MLGKEKTAFPAQLLPWPKTALHILAKIRRKANLQAVGPIELAPANI